MDLNEAIIARLERLKTDIQNRLEDFKENATGRTSDSIRVEVDGNVFRLVAGGQDTAPIATLETGNPPRTYVSIDKLEEWAIAKHQRYGTPIPNPYAVQKAIWEHGTIRYTNPRDIYSTLVEECAEELQDVLKVIVTDIVKSNLEEIYG